MCLLSVRIGMSTDVRIDPDEMTVSATRSLRSAGNSLTLTIPPQVLDAIQAEKGDDIQLVAHMETGEIVCSKVEDSEE